MPGDYTCPVCSTTFTQAGQLTRHIRSHPAEVPYEGATARGDYDQFARGRVNRFNQEEPPSVDTSVQTQRRPPSFSSQRIPLRPRAWQRDSNFTVSETSTSSQRQSPQTYTDARGSSFDVARSSPGGSGRAVNPAGLIPDDDADDWNLRAQSALSPGTSSVSPSGVGSAARSSAASSYVHDWVLHRGSCAPSIRSPLPSSTSRSRASSTADSSAASLYPLRFRNGEAQAMALERENAVLERSRRRRAEWLSDQDQQSVVREQMRHASQHNPAGDLPSLCWEPSDADSSDLSAGVSFSGADQQPPPIRSRVYAPHGPSGSARVTSLSQIRALLAMPVLESPSSPLGPGQSRLHVAHRRGAKEAESGVGTQHESASQTAPHPEPDGDDGALAEARAQSLGQWGYRRTARERGVLDPTENGDQHRTVSGLSFTTSTLPYNAGRSGTPSTPFLFQNTELGASTTPSSGDWARSEGAIPEGQLEDEAKTSIEDEFVSDETEAPRDSKHYSSHSDDSSISQGSSKRLFGRDLTLRMKSFKNRNDELVLTNISSVEIDNGSTAHIYKAELTAESLTVVLKVFPSVLSKTGRRLLRRELKTASHLVEGSQCDRIVPFIGTTEYGGRTVLVSQFMANGNVLGFLRRNPEANRQTLMLQVAEGVTFLHLTSGLVHGDLKCENVLVTAEGTAVLADFGLSTTIDKLGRATATEVRLWNTLSFAAPELHMDDAMFRGKKLRSKTPMTDVYAFGMLMLQAFTGKRPWAGLEGQAIVIKVCAGGIPDRPRSNVTSLGLTDKWWGICLKCWRKDPFSRPPIDRVLGELRATARIAHGTFSLPGSAGRRGATG